MTIKTPRAWFHKLKIQSKIWLCMVTVMFGLVLFIGELSLRYFTKLFIEDSNENAKNSLTITGQTFTSSYGELIAQFVQFAATQTLQDIVHDELDGGEFNYTKNYNLLQNPLSIFKNSNSLISSVIVVGPGREMYGLNLNALREYSFPDYFGWDFADVRNITWMPARATPPGISSAVVVPVVIPLRRLQPTNYLVIDDSLESAATVIILLLDAEKLTASLSQTASVYSDNVIYLANKKGDCINLSASSPFYGIASTPAVTGMTQSGANIGSFAGIPGKGQYLSYAKRLDFGGLSLVNILSKKSLFDRLNEIKLFIMLVATAGFAATAFLSYALSKVVTRPISRLTDSVRQIQDNRYDNPYESGCTDEIGQLNGAINSMYDTIQNQIARIKQDERAKFHSEIQLQAEQINPHFLYNTLECINLEVLSGHTETAVSMIENLGESLRIGLNYGEDTIAVSREIGHARAYFNIMNCRFNQTIKFTSEVSPGIEDHRILKTILQPLVENCIRHGFAKDRCEGILVAPTIEIIVLRQGDSVVIEVADNGCGMDIDRATDIMRGTSAEKHIGLRNVYRRLCIFYGSVDVTFQSIPFFRNSVIITIPFTV